MPTVVWTPFIEEDFIYQEWEVIVVFYPQHLPSRATNARIWPSFSGSRRTAIPPHGSYLYPLSDCTSLLAYMTLISFTTLSQYSTSFLHLISFPNCSTSLLFVVILLISLPHSSASLPFSRLFLTLLQESRYLDPARREQSPLRYGGSLPLKQLPSNCGRDSMEWHW
jgi:hypothetical protein